MSDKTGRKLRTLIPVKVRKPLTAAFAMGRLLTDNRFGQTVEARYRFFTMRITAAQMIFLCTANKRLPAVTQIIKERSDKVNVDIHTLAKLKVELTNEVAGQLLARTDYRPTYQEMLFFQTLLGGRSSREYNSLKMEAAAESEAVKRLLLQLLQEAYFSVKRGGRKGIYHWLMSRGAAGVSFEADEVQEFSDRYEARRFESEVLYHLKRREEAAERLEKREQMFYSQELYFLKKETEVYQERAVQESQETRNSIMYQSSQRLDTLADTVYEKLEKRMDNERKRRGM